MTCNNPREAHSPIEGNITPTMATYPRLLCRVFVKAMRSNDKEYKNLRQLVATLERERALVNGTENDELIEHPETNHERGQPENRKEDNVHELLEQETETERNEDRSESC